MYRSNKLYWHLADPRNGIIILTIALLLAVSPRSLHAQSIKITSQNRNNFSLTEVTSLRYACMYLGSRTAIGLVNRLPLARASKFQKLKSRDIKHQLRNAKKKRDLLTRLISKNPSTSLQRALQKTNNELKALKDLLNSCVHGNASIYPTPSPSLSPSASESPTNSPSASPSASGSPSTSPSPTFSASPSPSASISPSPTPDVMPDGFPPAEPTPNFYPRLSGQMQWVHLWPEASLYELEEISAPNIVEDIEFVKNRAVDHGHSDWSNHIKFSVNYSFETSYLSDPNQWPPQKPNSWIYQSADHNPRSALQVVIYENAIRGVDWMLRDQNGQVIPIWGTAYATNWSAACPKGAWDGHFTFNGQDISIGDSRGLNLVEWMSGPMKNIVMKGSRYKAAIQGLIWEDGPYVGLPCWMHPNIIVDPAHTGNLMTCEEYSNFSFPTFQYFVENFLGDLKDDFIIRTNGHFTAPWQIDTPATQLLFQNTHGPKFEAYGNWFGWPNYDNATWFTRWSAVEESYKPFGLSSYYPPLDSSIGQNIALAQILPKREAGPAAIRQWCRHRLGHTLMFDGLASFAWFDDPFGQFHIQGDIPEWPDFPEMHLRLGHALGANQQILPPGRPDKPIYFRQFENNGQHYTVAVNLWTENLLGIPASDAIWFSGDWPSGQYAQIQFP